MAFTSPSMMLMVVSVALGANGSDLDSGHWNYREGADSVNVASVRSVTRVLDVWGKRIFKEIKTLLHSEPSTLLPDYSRVRPLSESINDLFREVSLMHRRITELSHRLATLEPFLRRLGYQRESWGEALDNGAENLKEGTASLTRHDPRKPALKGSWVVRKRRVRVLKNRTGRSARDQR